MPGTRLTLAIVWLTAFNFRLVIIGTPPVLPGIRADLHLSLAAAGSISSLIIACLGAGALPGAVLTNRFGPRRVVTAAGAALTAGALSRLLPPQAAWLFLGTALLTLSVAAAQPALTLLLRLWFPGRIERTSSLLTSGLFTGGLMGAVTTPLVAAAWGWRASFLIWAAAALVGAAVWARFAPPAPQERLPTRIGGLLSEPAVWLAAVLFASQNLAYFNTATWIPFELHRSGPGAVALVLFLLSAIAIVPTIVLARVRWPFATSPSFYLAGATLTVAGALGLLLGLDRAAWALGMFIGAGTALTFMGALALPPLLARRDADVAGFTALMLGAGYLASFAGPALGGALADATHVVSASFWPSVAGGLLMGAAGLALARGQRVGAS
jgi:CP family cyanate transporter-like MFS transporter